jgi:hypothetical protein
VTGSRQLSCVRYLIALAAAALGFLSFPTVPDRTLAALSAIKAQHKNP